MLRGWSKEAINGIDFELNSILVEKWKGKAYRLVIQRQKRLDGDLDLWEGQYTYRCILTNDYTSSARDAFKFISVPAKWDKTARQHVLNVYTDNRAYAGLFPEAYG